MLRTEGSRMSLFCGFTLAAILLAVLGQFAASGVVAIGLIVIAVLFNCLATLLSAHIVDYGNGASLTIFGALSTIFSLIVGCIFLGWWGLAYAGGSVVGYLISNALKR